MKQNLNVSERLIQQLLFFFLEEQEEKIVKKIKAEIKLVANGGKSN